jgi:hypothetical protein
MSSRLFVWTVVDCKLNGLSVEPGSCCKLKSSDSDRGIGSAHNAAIKVNI